MSAKKPGSCRATANSARYGPSPISSAKREAVPDRSSSKDSSAVAPDAMSQSEIASWSHSSPSSSISSIATFFSICSSTKRLSPHSSESWWMHRATLEYRSSKSWAPLCSNSEAISSFECERKWAASLAHTAMHSIVRSIARSNSNSVASQMANRNCSRLS
ncbi:hypothetical protein D3C80_1087980 [compost metagenome]